MNQSPLSLHDLTLQIKETLEGKFLMPQWVIAEISDLHTNRTGHCYLELIQKNEQDDQIIARCRATIWAYSFKMVKTYFETSTGQTFKSGLKVLLKVSIEYSEIYGISLNIKDIDPSYTLGDIALRRKQIIDQLKEEGVFEMNKEIQLPLVPQRLAIISSPTAAGYEDFCQQLDNNSRQFKFYHKLFPATMQGNNTEESIITALERIYAYEQLFDAVIIIRGGGSTSDLMSFDSYELALNITQFPLPVITGIGHERDTTIIDLVAHTNLKTPTAVAEFIIDIASDFEDQINLLFTEFKESALEIITEQKTFINNAFQIIPSHLKSLFNQNKHHLDNISKQIIANSRHTIKYQMQNLDSNINKLTRASKTTIQQQSIKLKSTIPLLTISIKNILTTKKNSIQIIEVTNRMNDPINILKRGYSITTIDGKIIKNRNQIKKGDLVNTQLSDGEFKSIVE